MENKIVKVLKKDFFTKKKVNIITIIICFLIILTFELGYCNSTNFFHLMNKNINELNYNFSICRIVIYSTILLVYLVLNKKFIEESVETLKNKKKKWLVVIFEFITIILIILLLLFLLKNPLMCRGISTTIITVLLFNILLLHISNNQANNMLVIGFTIGTVFAITIQFNHQLDERQHFITAVNLASIRNRENPILDESLNQIPYYAKYTEVDKFIAEDYNKVLMDNNNLEDVSSLPTTYNPILYVAPAIGIAIGRLLNGSILDIYILGRLCNLILYVILTYLSIKIIPYKKNLLLAVAVLPMTLALAATYTIDGMCIGFVFLFVAYVLKIQKERKIIKLKDFIILLFIFILMLTAKSMAYIAVGMLVLLLPIKKTIIENKKYLPIFLLSFVILVVILIGLVLYIEKTKITPEVRIGGNLNTDEQMKFLLKNPLKDIELMINHIIDTLLSFSWLSSLNHEVFFGPKSRCIFLLLIIYFTYLALSEDDINLKLKEKIMFIITFFAVFYITSLVLYLSCTEVGAMHVVGYQARYIFPIIPLLLFCVSNKRLKSFKDVNYDMRISIISSIFIMINLANVIIL